MNVKPLEKPSKSLHSNDGAKSRVEEAPNYLNNFYQGRRNWAAITGELEKQIVDLKRNNQTLQQKYEEALVEMDKLRKRSMIYEKKMNEATVNYKDLLQCTEQMKLDIEQTTLGRVDPKYFVDMKVLHAKIQEKVQEMHDHASNMETELEQRALEGFRSRLTTVKQELQFKEKMAVRVLKHDQTIAALESQLEWIRSEATELDEQNQKISKDNKQLRLDREIDSAEWRNVRRENVLLKKENAKLQAEIHRLKTNNTSPIPNTTTNCATEDNSENTLSDKEESSDNIGLSGFAAEKNRGTYSQAKNSSAVASKRVAENNINQVEKLREMLKIANTNLRNVQRDFAHTQILRSEIQDFIIQCIDKQRDNLSAATKPSSSAVGNKIKELSIPKHAPRPVKAQWRKDVLDQNNLGTHSFTAADRAKVLQLLMRKQKFCELLLSNITPEKVQVAQTIS